MDHIKNKDILIKLLKDAFCEEMNAWYQYLIVIPFIHGIERSAIQKRLKEIAKDEYEDHALWLLERISMLGGTPSWILSPQDWNKIASHKYIMPSMEMSVNSIIEQNIKAERNAIDTYVALEKYSRDIDPVTNLKIK